jgi:putative transposase
LALRHSLSGSSIGYCRFGQCVQSFFARRVARPVKKKKWKCKDSFRYPQGFQIEEGNSRIYLPKIGWVRYRSSRALEGIARNVTVSRCGDKWFVSIQTEFEIREPRHLSSSQIGVDLGVCNFAVASDGTFVEPLNPLRKREYRLRRCQRVMSRKTKFSKNWKKAKVRVARQHEKVTNSRKDFLHKLTTDQTKTHSLICIEDLKVGNMTRSASGTLDEPGSNVKQKSSLNRSILDQGWAEYRRQLEYKMKWAGGQVIVVPAMNTSRKCPSCGLISKDNRKTRSMFVCTECGFAANADYVASLNILAAGLAVFEGPSFDDACGGVVEVGPPEKQEPTERVA